MTSCLSWVRNSRIDERSKRIVRNYYPELKDAKVVAEAEESLRKLKADVGRRELEALLSGEADANDSYVEVHAGSGGTESQDWAQMLLRMYMRWAEQHDYKVQLLEASEGEQAGIMLELK